MTLGTGPPPNAPDRNPRASRLCFCATSCTVPFTFGRSSLSCFHFSPRAAMVLYSDRSADRLFRNARSIASRKVRRRMPGVGLDSATLPNTTFCEEEVDCPGAVTVVWAASGNSRSSRMLAFTRNTRTVWSRPQGLFERTIEPDCSTAVGIFAWTALHSKELQNVELPDNTPRIPGTTF